MELYAAILNKFDRNRTWIAGISYFPRKTVIELPNSQFAILGRPMPGVVSYCVVDMHEVDFLIDSAITGITYELASAIVQSVLVEEE